MKEKPQLAKGLSFDVKSTKLVYEWLVSIFFDNGFINSIFMHKYTYMFNGYE